MDKMSVSAARTALADFCLSCNREHQPREHAVPCSVCKAPALAHDAKCKIHTEHVVAGMIPGLFQS